MPFQLGGRSPHSPRGSRPALPDFSSRATRSKIFVVVGAILLGSGLLARWNDPGLRRLLGLAPQPVEGGSPRGDHERFDGEVDTRLRHPDSSDDSPPLVSVETPPTSPPEGSGSSPAAPPSTEAGESSAEPTPAESPESTESPDSGAPHPAEAARSQVLVEAWRDAWESVLDDLPVERETRLYDRLRAARGKSAPYAAGARELAEWTDDLDLWDRAWRDYVAKSRQALERIPDAERETWSGVLDQVSFSWSSHWRPLLETLGESPERGVEPLALAAILQAAADARATRAVQDDTVWRSTDANLWFRLIEQLQTATPEQLTQRSTGLVGYLPLFKQSEFYRGKIVTIRGVARLAYRVDAPRNSLGVSEYAMLWVHPAGGPAAPIVVYALQLPAGFPAVPHRNRDSQTKTLNEEVEITGYFFKRWAYEARDGINTAPLLLTAAPRWQPSVAKSSGPPPASEVASVVVGAAVIGLSIAGWAVWNSRRRK